ncbi:MAG: hypothetical protein HC896_12200 [Bacteroidales bacterium]|nr:hypothetical protein [Bacteroidales bacterium]
MALTIEETMRMAISQSPGYIAAVNELKSSYWAFRTHKASNYPNLSLRSDLFSLNNSFQKDFQGRPVYQGTEHEQLHGFKPKPGRAPYGWQL